MNTFKKTLFAGLFLVFAGQGHSAGYLKIEGIDGESKDSKRPSPSQEIKVQKPKEERAGLLLPAVQKVRASDDSKPPRKPAPKK